MNPNIREAFDSLKGKRVGIFAMSPTWHGTVFEGNIRFSYFGDEIVIAGDNNDIILTDLEDLELVDVPDEEDPTFLISFASGETVFNVSAL